MLPEDCVTVAKIHRLVVHVVPQSITGLQRKASISGDEWHGFSTKHRPKTAEPAVFKTYAFQPLRKPSPLKSMAVSNTARKVSFPQDTFFLCSEGSSFSPLCSKSSVLHGSCHLHAPGRRIRSRGAVLRLPETCTGEDPGTGDTPRPTERPGGLSNDPGTLQDTAICPELGGRKLIWTKAALWEQRTHLSSHRKCPQKGT